MTTAPVISPVNTDARKQLGIRPGDTVRVMQKIQEKGKTRLQAFEGLVLGVKHGAQAGGTFTVRKVASGVGVEKTFPLYSPMIDKIEIVKRTKVRQAKLYYIREKAAKEIRRAMRNAYTMNEAIESDTAEKERLAREAEEAEKKRQEEEAADAAKKAEEEAKAAEEAAKVPEEVPAEGAAAADEAQPAEAAASPDEEPTKD